MTSGDFEAWDYEALDNHGVTMNHDDRDPSEYYRGETRAQLAVATVMSLIAIGGLIAANWFF